MSEVPKSPPETPFKTEGQHADSEPPHDYSFTPAGPPPLSTQSLAFSDPSMAKTPKPPAASSDREDQDPRAPLPAFDWEDFERRYEQKLAEANERENQIIQEFDQLTNFFMAWTLAASEHDNERAIKRLKTRETFVQRAEVSLEAKKKHYTDVVEAFKAALRLLSPS